MVLSHEVERTRLLSGEKSTHNCVAFSPNSTRIAAGSSDTILIWDVVTGEMIVTHKYFVS